MNLFQAKRIANHFSEVTAYQVGNRRYGVTISYKGDQARFEDETCFWAFLSLIAQERHQEKVVAEAAAKLIV